MYFKIKLLVKFRKNKYYSYTTVIYIKAYAKKIYEHKIEI
jgi:hypothetical protein